MTGVQGGSPVHKILFVLVHSHRDKTESHSGNDPAEDDGIFGLTMPYVSLITEFN
jgi:hypothetical protein